MPRPKDPKKVERAKAQARVGNKFVSTSETPDYDQKAKIEKGELLRLNLYQHELTEENPFLYNKLERIALTEYLKDTNERGETKKFKTDKRNAGERVYDKLFNYIKEEVWQIKYDSRRGEKRVQKMVREDLGLNKDELGDLFEQGPVTANQFYQNICQPTSKRLAGLLNEISTASLDQSLLNDGVRNYLVKQARKYGIRKIKPENIMTVEDLRALIQAIIQTTEIVTGVQGSLLEKLTKPSLN